MLWFCKAVCGSEDAGSYESVMPSTTFAGDFTAKYSFNDSTLLGRGSYGRVFKGTDSFRDFYAIKHVTKASALLSALSMDDQQLDKYLGLMREEVRITKSLQHPNIVKYVESFEDARNFYIVMELCWGGNVTDLINQRSRESDVAIAMAHLLGAVKYIHEQCVCHRDIKPENLLLMSKEEMSSNTVKLVDFGVACACTQDQKLYEPVGTAFYMAPEVIELRYGLSADIWSCGVVMFNMLSGRLPFPGATSNEVKSAVRRGNFSFVADVWASVSDDAKDLIRGLMAFAATGRFTAQQGLGHVWVSQKAPRALRR